VALAHDLGHTPFGHAGERILAQLNPDGFRHQDQSLRQVDVLARNRRGLNLTLDVRDGIVKHSKGQGPVFVTGQEAPQTLEGMLVRVSDIIAYLGHDLDDGLRAGLLQKEEIPKSIIDRFGLKASSRIRVMVTDLLEHTRAEAGSLNLSFSSELDKDMLALRSFLYSQVYRHPRLDEELNRGREVVEIIYHAFMAEDELFLQLPGHDTDSRSQAVCDFIAGVGIYRIINQIA
jgi:dGTPase